MKNTYLVLAGLLQNEASVLRTRVLLHNEHFLGPIRIWVASAIHPLARPRPHSGSSYGVASLSTNINNHFSPPSVT